MLIVEKKKSLKSGTLSFHVKKLEKESQINQSK